MTRWAILNFKVKYSFKIHVREHNKQFQEYGDDIDIKDVVFIDRALADDVSRGDFTKLVAMAQINLHAKAELYATACEWNSDGIAKITRVDIVGNKMERSSVDFELNNTDQLAAFVKYLETLSTAKLENATAKPGALTYMSSTAKDVKAPLLRRQETPKAESTKKCCLWL